MWATETGSVPEHEIKALQALAASLEWRVFPDKRGYQTAEAPPMGYSRAFFIKIPPHSAVHRHRDKIPTPTDHIVIATNPHCLNWWADSDGEHSTHMELGKRYTVDRDAEHWAVNDGETDRIHLLIEY